MTILTLNLKILNLKSKAGIPVELLSREDKTGWCWARYTFTLNGVEEKEVRQVHVSDLYVDAKPLSATGFASLVRKLPGFKLVEYQQTGRGRKK